MFVDQKYPRRLPSYKTFCFKQFFYAHGGLRGYQFYVTKYLKPSEFVPKDNSLKRRRMEQ
jgi:hypothetical protein